MTERQTGILKSVGLTTDEDNRPVLRAIVDFYDNAAPEANIGTIWNRRPVQIVEATLDRTMIPQGEDRTKVSPENSLEEIAQAIAAEFDHSEDDAAVHRAARNVIASLKARMKVAG